MRKKTILIVLAMTCSMAAFPQKLEWVKQIEGGVQGKALDVDASGNVYTAGVFYWSQAIDFDPGSGTCYFTPWSNQDIFIQKLDSNGNFLWAKQIGGMDGGWMVYEVDNVESIKIDNSGNIYIIGSVFSNQVDFDPGPGTFFTNTAGGFILKLDANGNFLWVKQAGIPHSIAIDSNGNVYTTGLLIGTQDMDPGSGIINLTSVNEDGYVLKLDSLGNFLWVKQVGGSGGDMGLGINIDQKKNILITGYFQQTVDFDPGPGTYYLSSSPLQDPFILKLNSEGDFMWARQISGGLGMVQYGEDLGSSITTDFNGNVISTGRFSATADFDQSSGQHTLTSQGGFDAYILKLDSSGGFGWVKSIGSSYNEHSFSIATDDLGYVYSSGFFRGIFIYKLGPSGDSLWMKRCSEYEMYEGHGGYSITLDQCKNIYVTGEYYNSDDFDPDTSSYYLENSGSFTLKWSQSVCGTESVPLSEFTLYPNPTNGDFTIDLSMFYEKTTVTVSDISGRIIYNRNFENCSKLPVHLNTAQGFYIVSVKADGDSFVRKIIKN